MRLAIAVVVILLVLGLSMAICPPFLMPNWMYNAVYGWRYPKQWTCGHAEVTDFGPGAARDRYIVSLERLSAAGEFDQTFNLCGLPREQLVIGLVVPVGGADRRDWQQEWQAAQDSTADVILYLGSSVVVQHSGSLADDWTWSGPVEQGPFLYGDTAFFASPNEDYVLQVRGNFNDELLSRTYLSVRGGGWK